MPIIAPLIIILSAAAWYDVRAYRIPNFLTIPGAALGILLNATLPSGLGIATAAGGFALALIGLFPLYLLRIWGAGDVKLMLVVGAFLGPIGLLGSLLATMVVGGVSAIAIALKRRGGHLLVNNVRIMLWQLFFNTQLRTAQPISVPVQSAGKVAYALPILLGTLTYIVWRTHA